MHILVVNPNTTASMTQKIGAAAQAVAASGTAIEAVNPTFGPPSIEGFYDEVFSIPGLLAQMRAAPSADAYVIACFDDTGLARRAVSPPRQLSASARPPSTWPAWWPIASAW